MDEVDFYLIDLKSRFDKIKPNTYYLSYSGGKDSHFLYWFIKEYLKRDDIMIVGINTYMEHHEILERIKKNSDVVLLPKLKPMEIKEKYGIPCFSKEQDFYIYYYQNALRKGKKPSRTIQEKIDGTYKTGFCLSKKAREYVKSGNAHKITHLCCHYLKKEPARRFEKETGLKPILGIRGGESDLRKRQYTSCFTKDGKFTPLHDLSDELMDKIYKKYNIEIPEVYNHICRTGCFTPDVEVCTDKGFIRLDELKGDEKILSISDSGSLEYKPYKKVEFDYEGDMVSVKLQNKYVLATPDHRFIGYDRDTKKNETKMAENISRLSIFANMRFIDDGSRLSDIEKIYIAIQADGSLCKKYSDYTYEFHLKKERKINRLKELLEKCNIKYTYMELKNGTAKIIFKLNIYAKDLCNCFDISEIGVSKAKEMIEEMSLWDGHKSKDGRISFSNTNKEQVNFYSVISVIAGYSHSQYTDESRNNKWKDVYYLTIYTKSNRNFQQKRKETQYYNGKVHCVDIGGRLCVFRKDGKSFVAYNCMGCPYGSYKHDTEKELNLVNENQRKFVEKYFKESYEVLGIKTKEENKWQDK